MSGLSTPVLVRCFLRSYFVGAAYNAHGLLNIGFVNAIDPGLRALYGPGEQLRAARMRYAVSYNCHPFFTPMLLGALLETERRIKDGRFDVAMLSALKDTGANAYSAIGDSFFNGTLLNTWALSTGTLVLAGMAEQALWITGAFFCLLHLFKFATFALGLRQGLDALFYMSRFDLINWGVRVKCVNAVLLTVFLWTALVREADRAYLPLLWCGVIAYLMWAGWFVGRVHMPRIVAGIVLLAFVMALHSFGLLEQLSELTAFLPGSG